MAQIDFTNAVIEPAGSTYKPFSYYKLGLGLQNNFNTYFTDDNGSIVPNTYITPTILTNTPTKLSLVYTGTISSTATGGSYFYLGLTGSRIWKISNISYSAGDTFSLQVDFDITVS